MERRELGQSGLQVSKLCLGTMTFGDQNSEAEAHEQMDYAVANGINFFDTAEMYPVPPRGETQGLTERYIGTWLDSRKARDKIILATKVTGPGDWMVHIRKGPDLSREQIRSAIEQSLRRLKTNYVDLYQLHWPSRATNFFGQLGYVHQDKDCVPLQESLQALVELQREGKIRHYGLSNETPWGLMTANNIVEREGWPKPVSIQNPYNLLNRSFEVGLAEVVQRERIGMMAYSPMAFGVLSGKYLQGKRPIGRVSLHARFSRYSTIAGEQATEQYVALAHELGLSPAQLALAFVAQQPFVSTSIIGATSMTQLRENIASVELLLSNEVLAQLDAIHARISNPCP